MHGLTLLLNIAGDLNLVRTFIIHKLFLLKYYIITSTSAVLFCIVLVIIAIQNEATGTVSPIHRNSKPRPHFSLTNHSRENHDHQLALRL